MNLREIAVEQMHVAGINGSPISQEAALVSIAASLIRVADARDNQRSSLPPSFKVEVSEWHEARWGRWRQVKVTPPGGDRSRMWTEREEP